MYHSNVQGRFQVECDLCIKPFSSNSIVNRLKSFRSRLDLADHEEDEEQEEIVHQGQLVLDSGADPLSSFANKGIERYSIQTSTSVALELTIAFWLEEADKQQEQDETDSEEEELYTPIDQDVLRYCQAGDYLTFYVKSDTHPVSIHICQIRFDLLTHHACSPSSIVMEQILGYLSIQSAGLEAE